MPRRKVLSYKKRYAPKPKKKRFPRFEEQRQAWVRAVRRDNWQPTQSSALCSEHFTVDCINRTAVASVCLRPNAIPTIFKGFPPHLQKIQESTEPTARSGNVPGNSFSGAMEASTSVEKCSLGQKSDMICHKPTWTRSTKLVQCSTLSSHQLSVLHNRADNVQENADLGNGAMEMEDENPIENLVVKVEIDAFPTVEDMVDVHYNPDIPIKTEPPDAPDYSALEDSLEQEFADIPEPKVELKTEIADDTEHFSSEDDYIVPNHLTDSLCSSNTRTATPFNGDSRKRLFNIFDAQPEDRKWSPQLLEELEV